MLYKRHELLHGTLDFWYLFHPVHSVSVVREVPSQLIVHFLQGVQSGVLPRRVRTGHVDDAMSGFLGRCCIFLWKNTKRVSGKATLGSQCLFLISKRDDGPCN